MFAAVVGTEKSGRKRAGPKPAGLIGAAGLQCPDLKQ
jgi:hypothetical protein